MSKATEELPSQEFHAIDPSAPNPGNPVFTCDKNFTAQAKTSVSTPRTQEPFSQPQHPMYGTSSSAYGSLHSTVETTPTSFHGRSQKFSEHLGKSGMYRNQSLNTAMDSSKA